MLEALIDIWSRIAGMAVAGLVNTSLIAVAAVGIAVLAARHKGWSAATRYGLWWILLVFVIAAPAGWCLLAGQQTSPSSRAFVAPVLATGLSSTVPTATPAKPIPPSPVRPSIVAMILLCWIAASTAQFIRVLRSFLYGLRLKRSSTAPNSELTQLFDGLRTRLSVGRSAKLSISDDLTSPVVVGYWKPQVMIPAALVWQFSPSELEQIILHELAHVARYDDWAIAVQRLMEAAGIFHPLVRYLAHRLNLDREMACDDRVAQICERGGYAECLAKVAQMNTFSAASAVLVPLLERKPELLARIEALLDNTRTHLPHGSRPRLVAAFTAVSMLGIVGLRAPRLVAMPSAAPPVTSSSDTASPIYSIVITSDDGRNSSMFGSWSGYTFGDSGREPGTIEFKSDNKVYVIRDKGVLAEAQKILQPMRELGRRQSELGERQSKLGDAQSFLGEQQSKVADRPLDAEAQAKIAQKLQALEARIQELKSKQLAQSPSDVQEQLSNLQSALAEMQSDIGSVQAKLGETQGELGQKQAALGEQQAKLGKLQADLGAQQETEGKLAEKRLRDLIRTAQARGLVRQISPQP